MAVQGLPAPGVQGHRAMLGGLDIEPPNAIADVSGLDPELLIAAHQRFGCPVHLVDLADAGTLGGAPAPWPETVAARLAAAGVPEADIRIIRAPGDLPEYDLVAALGRFGAGVRVKNLGWFLRRALSPRGRLFIDIAKGSGGFPFLRRFGNCTPLTTWQKGDRRVERVVMTAEPAQSTTPDAAWDRVAAKLIGPGGFYTHNDRHSFTYIPRGRTLCVTFDNLDIAMEKRDDRRPWGFSFIEAQGWSMLGVMANGWTWFRDPWVTGEFLRLRDEGFFASFEQVIFYGASMGGYGALAFSAAHPGSNVVVFSPQTVLDKRLVPWETRYRVAWDYDYSDAFGDAAKTVAAARRVNVFYDPYSDLDARHAARLGGPNIVHLRTPFFGHRLGSMLQQMGLLQPLVLNAMAGDLGEAEFARALRARRDFPRWRREMVERLIDRGRLAWAEGLCRRFHAEGGERYFRTTLERLERERAA